MKNDDNSTLLSRRVAKVLPNRDGLEDLAKKQKLRVYLGIDPTGSRLHLGHTIGLRLLMDFANAGHDAILLFGTGTVLVGDPSLRDEARKTIAQETIKENIANWKEQAASVIDFDKVTIRENGDWLTNMTLKDLVSVASNISSVQLFKRESFTRRIERGDTVWYHETMYPLLQGYDSVELEADVEIGGTDQEFNMLMGRELRKKMQGKDKYVVESFMILGTDGKQMSKSSGNCVWLDDSPNDMYGKIMSIPDDQIINYAKLCSEMPLSEVEQIETSLQNGENPRDLKAKVAYSITSLYHGDDNSKEAESAFVSQFQKDQIPENIEEFTPQTDSILDLLVDSKLVSSKSDARRMLEQNAVKLNQTVINLDFSETVNDGDVLQVGKRRFIKIKK